MILNGRRIEERAQIAQQGGAEWLADHLRLNGFDPFAIDGSDPAAFAWAIVEAEQRLERFITDPARRYPAPIPYVIAETVKRSEEHTSELPSLMRISYAVLCLKTK